MRGGQMGHRRASILASLGICHRSARACMSHIVHSARLLPLYRITTAAVESAAVPLAPIMSTLMRHLLVSSLLALAFLTPVLPLHAQDDPTVDPAILNSSGFLAAHPDINNRQLGLLAYERGDFVEAFKRFKRAARFADKPSQGMVGEMLWRGEGVEVDRASAYAWMDVAAERAFVVLLVKREQYWSELSADERDRALEIGKTLYAEYADSVAKNRLEAILRRGKSKLTGSRTGFVGSLQIQLVTPNGLETVDASNYYDDKFWKPDAYWAWQDKAWKERPKGIVDIGPIQHASPPISPTPEKQ